MSDKNDFLGSVGKLIELAPDVYEDGLKETVVESSKTLAKIPRFLNALAANFDIWMMKREANVKAVSILIELGIEFRNVCIE